MCRGGYSSGEAALLLVHCRVKRSGDGSLSRSIRRQAHKKKGRENERVPRGGAHVTAQPRSMLCEGEMGGRLGGRGEALCVVQRVKRQEGWLVARKSRRRARAAGRHWQPSYSIRRVRGAAWRCAEKKERRAESGEVACPPLWRTAACAYVKSATRVEARSKRNRRHSMRSRWSCQEGGRERAQGHEEQLIIRQIRGVASATAKERNAMVNDKRDAKGHRVVQWGPARAETPTRDAH